MEIKTKFDIGDTVYWANYAGVCCGRIQFISIYKNNYGYPVISYSQEVEIDNKLEQELFSTFQEAETRWKEICEERRRERLKLYNNNGKSTK